MTTPVVWLNGELIPADRPLWPGDERGLLYGDGLFETMRAYGGHVFRLTDHLRRLHEAAAHLAIAPLPDAATLAGTVENLLAANNLSARHDAGDAYLRITVTRGRGGAPADLHAAGTPSVLMTTRRFDGYGAELYTRGMRLATSDIRRNDTSPLSRLKTLNYLDSILARARALEGGYDEALMQNTRGAVAEAASANIFAVSEDGAILTPPVSDGLLPGITRAVVMELAEVTEVSMMPDCLAAAREVFLTNSLMEIMPVTAIDGEPVGDGQPGPVTRQLMQRFREQVIRETRETVS